MCLDFVLGDKSRRLEVISVTNNEVKRAHVKVLKFMP